MAENKKTTKKTTLKAAKEKDVKEKINEDAVNAEVDENVKPVSKAFVTTAEKSNLIKAWKLAAKKDHMFTGELNDEWDTLTDSCARSSLIYMGTELNHLTAFLQSELSRQGVFNGEIDGIFRSDLRDAVNEYLRRNNITPNGIVGYFFWKDILN